MNIHHYVACDLGAESGRVMLGTLTGEQLTLEEVHRFPNGPVEISGSLRWDVLRLFDEIKHGLRIVAGRGVEASSLSCDSWGVDYVLLHGAEPFLTAPYHYRDPRTNNGFEKAFAVVSAEEIFAETGVQFMTINTLYQLLADNRERPQILRSADRFLMIGDYFNYLLSGVPSAEESLASTSQLYNPRHRQWSEKLIKRFGLPEHIFPKVVPSGTVLGPLLPSVAEETGLRAARVIAGCSHDTAAAVAAVPSEGDHWAYLSSGTWSLLGVQLAEPVITERSREYNFTNEVGVAGTIRFLKNISGLWIVQECRRAWAREGHEYAYEELTEMAAAALPFVSLIDPLDPRFLNPENMVLEIAGFCRETGQRVPQTPGGVVRCALEGLALSYGCALRQLEELAGRKLATIHIVGGGSRNRLLNQLTANATGCTVLAGPVECTAIGNVLVQALALGHIRSLGQARRIVRTSFPLDHYEPADAQQWEQARRRFESSIHILPKKNDT